MILDSILGVLDQQLHNDLGLSRYKKSSAFSIICITLYNYLILDFLDYSI